MDQNRNTLTLSHNDKIDLEENVVNCFARGEKPEGDQDAPEEGTKPIMIAFRDIDEDAYNTLKANNEHFETEQSREVLMAEMTLLAVFGLRDEARPGVADTLIKLRESRTFTRICSGDHEHTVRSFAKELSMDLNLESNYEILVESGKEFREAIGGGMVRQKDPKTGHNTWVFKDEEAAMKFEAYGPRVLMLYRASPEDKHMLVAGLK